MSSFNPDRSAGTIDATSHTQRRDLSTLQNGTFDVVIIGGGISGAWLALHCAQQGYSTALIEKADYASQTSSSSSKLLHGGVRYLQQMQFNKVRESALERAEYIHAAPHLSVAVPFIVPTYRSFQKSKLFLNCGMLAYQLLCIGEDKIIGSAEQTLPAIKSISATELNSLCDLSNEQHTGGVVFYERHMLDSERMTLAILQTAQAAGATVHNYVSAQDFLIQADRVVGLSCRDELSNNDVEIKSKLVVNAAGPWVDSLNSKLKNAERAPSINGFAVGSHIVTRQICDHAIALTTTHQSNAKIDRGGRHVFVIPWRGYSLIGTSYDEIDGPESDISIQASHVDQLLEAVNQAMPSAQLSRDDLVSGYCGLYPLRTNNLKSTVYQGSGEYQIIDHANANGIEGLVTSLGAKFTTGRKLSELSMRLINKKLARAPKRIEPCKLKASDYQSLVLFTQAKVKQYAEKFSQATVEHLIVQYGSDIDKFVARAAQDDALCEKICAHQEDIYGQVVWAIENEQAVTLNDMLFNRSSLGLLGISESEVKKVGVLMATHLGWSTAQHNAQEEQVLRRLAKTKAALLDS